MVSVYVSFERGCKQLIECHMRVVIGENTEKYASAEKGGV